MSSLPQFPVTAIHQIELTSRCNLRCRYCVHPTMPRKKLDMPMEVYARSLAWAKEFVRRGTQQQINLCGIGESTMVPDFVERVRLAREALGPKCDIVFATNGLLITEEMVVALKPYAPKIGISLHRPEKAGPALEIVKKHGLLSWISADPAIAAINWAGQVKWHVSVPAACPCPWVKGGWVFVMADGGISPCCLDGSGDEAIANIMEFDSTKHFTHPYKLCRNCDQELQIEGYDQRAA